MTEPFLALAERLTCAADPAPLTPEAVAAVKAARNDPVLRTMAEAVMARHPAAFPLFGARQAD